MRSISSGTNAAGQDGSALWSVCQSPVGSTAISESARRRRAIRFAPYDVTAHTLPMLMDVAVHPVKAPFQYSRQTGPVTETIESNSILRSGQTRRPAGASITHQFRARTKVGPDGSWIRRPCRMALSTTKSTRGQDRFQIIPGVTGKYYVIVYSRPAGTHHAGRLSRRHYATGIHWRTRTRRRQAPARLCRNWRYACLSESRVELRNRAVQTAFAQRCGWTAANGFLRSGSILRIELDTSHPIATGMPKETIAWAEDSPVFEVTNDPNATVPARMST